MRRHKKGKTQQPKGSVTVNGVKINHATYLERETSRVAAFHQTDDFKIPFLVSFVMLIILSTFVITTFVRVPRPEKHTHTPPKPLAEDILSAALKPGDAVAMDASNMLETALDCVELIDLAKDIIDKNPLDEWDPALDLLATCALQEPENSAPLWNLAVILLRMNHTEEALEFIDQAMTLDPGNLEYLKTSGKFLAQMGLHSKVIRCLESYLQVALNVPSWEQLLASISVQREDEWMFLYDAGEDVVDILQMLQSSYLHEMAWIKAGYLYKVIIGLRAEEVDKNLLIMYSIFAFGLGDFVTGIKYLRLFTEKQYISEGYGDQLQAYEVVTAHSLRLLTAGFDSQLLSIGKNLLMGGDSVWEELVYNCELKEESRFNYSVKIMLVKLRRIMIECLRVQNVISSLVDEGAVVYAENMFGWSPLLHAVALGSVEMVDTLLGARADPQSRTVLAHTSLHIAAMRGTFDPTETLLQAGLKSSEVDYFNRTALHVACLHGWSAQGMAETLRTSLPHGCPIKPLYHPPPKLSTYGGWPASGFTLPKELVSERCDFDVLSVPDVQTFVFDYLALQRPVLIRNATNVHSMKKLYHLWHQSKFRQEFGALTFNEVEVPYAESFGYTTTRKTSIKTFLGNMKQFQEDNKNVPIDSIPHPNYIFESVPTDSPILKDFKPPAVLNEEVTHINTLKLQFYLGPPLSGAPVHFHRNAWNVLVYGQKRWFLYPPDKAFYSKEPVWKWWKESYRRSPDALECVQYPGDMVFVPDMWGHAVINLRESVGVASEFIYGASEFSI